MPSPSEKLAASLEKLEHLQQDGQRVFRSNELSRTDAERLLKGGFLVRILGGWLLSSGPQSTPGDTTPWYASFWEFCVRYCADRFGDQWHLSPEQSLLLHAEDTVVPGQVVICAPAGTNHRIDLLFDTSLFDLRKEMPPPSDLMQRDGLRFFTVEAALTRVPEAFFQRHPVEARVVLGGLRDASALLQRLLAGGHSHVAGRLAGTLRHLGQGEVADEIVSAMHAAGYDVRESDALTGDDGSDRVRKGVAPVVSRLDALWMSCRERVLAVWPPPPGPPESVEAYVHRVEDAYQSDAYHSLSIEGYRVTPELIERVRSGDWNPDQDDDDRNHRDALAARGYWQAFQLVRDLVQNVLKGADAAGLVRSAHRDWYRALFQPSVAAGLIPAFTLAGYRGHPVYLRGSRHVPPRAEVVPDAMSGLFDLLEAEPEPAVRAVLGHWMFGYVHPFPDGNGRLARFVMNAMLASGGYPWTVIRVDDRDRYMRGLESASVEQDIGPFAEFLAECVRRS